MTPYYAHAGVDLYVGDCRTVLAELESESVQCVVTSPPYYGLRDYGTASWDGGDAACAHAQEPPRFNGPKQISAQVSGHASKAESNRRRSCVCGARRVDQQIGLESTPADYTDALVATFREVRRVLRADGTLWLNLGDSFATGGGAVGGAPGGGFQGSKWQGPMTLPNRMPLPGLKPKDLIGIPWRVAFALQADGWWLRSDIIWAKPNPMPESVTDRPTKAHEYLFLLSKSSRYLYQGGAIAETSVSDHASGNGYARPEQLSRGGRFRDRPWTPQPSAHMTGTPRNDGMRWRNAEGGVAPRGSRNKRSVWTVQPEPFPEAHFATFPTKLVEPCILAGSRPGDIVLDPFAGAGTTLLVAKNLERRAVGIELSPSYAAMIERRLSQDVLPLELTS